MIFENFEYIFYPRISPQHNTDIRHAGRSCQTNQILYFRRIPPCLLNPGAIMSFPRERGGDDGFIKTKSIEIRAFWKS
jgi:hypothetical protein